MNQNFPPKSKHTLCSICGCQEMRFFHRFLHNDSFRILCTSCVLRLHKESFCPTCLATHDFTSRVMSIRCSECGSYSHRHCFTSNGRPTESASICSSCINPNRLTFTLSESTARGGKGSHKGMDKNAADLLFTASKITAASMYKASKVANDSAEMQTTKFVLAKKKATGEVNHVIEYVDRENKRHNGVGGETQTEVIVEERGEDENKRDGSETDKGGEQAKNPEFAAEIEIPIIEALRSMIPPSAETDKVPTVVTLQKAEGEASVDEHATEDESLARLMKKKGKQPMTAEQEAEEKRKKKMGRHVAEHDRLKLPPPRPRPGNDDCGQLAKQQEENDLQLALAKQQEEIQLAKQQEEINLQVALAMDSEEVWSENSGRSQC